jgi:hypothetical protein
MTDKIESLTEEQQKAMPTFVDKWVKIGLCTDAADRPRAEEGVRKAYKEAGLTPPTEIIWALSPLEGARIAAQKMGVSLSQAMGGAAWGSHDASWLAYYDFFSYLGVKGPERLEGLMEIAKSAGWWWPLTDCAILTERPCELHRDDENRLHNESGMAIKYPDGWGFYVIHGVVVPEDVVMRPQEQTIEQIRNEPNAEIKRIRRERFGNARYLSEIKAQVIDVDSVTTQKGSKKASEITRALLQDDEGRRFLVGSDGSTNRVYYMEVPGTVKTCSEAHTFLSGFDEGKLIAQS